MTSTQAAEGVRVNVLVWNDATSIKFGKHHNGGMLATHDEETALYFKDSAVNVTLSMRCGSLTPTLVQSLVTVNGLG